MSRPEPDVYVTTYCNHPHCCRTGKPVRHGCYILPPQALQLERSGAVEAAIDVIQQSKPLRPHSGVRHP